MQDPLKVLPDSCGDHLRQESSRTQPRCVHREKHERAPSEERKNTWVQKSRPRIWVMFDGCQNSLVLVDPRPLSPLTAGLRHQPLWCWWCWWGGAVTPLFWIRACFFQAGIRRCKTQTAGWDFSRPAIVHVMSAKRSSRVACSTSWQPETVVADSQRVHSRKGQTGAAATGNVSGIVALRSATAHNVDPRNLRSRTRATRGPDIGAREISGLCEF